MTDASSMIPTEPVEIIPPTNEDIFVFGSNLSGIHGAGAAAFAANYRGAIWGKGEGLMGRSYALPTKGLNISHMGMREIKEHVNEFIHFASGRSDLSFQVTQVGCGLAGGLPEQIAPMFRHAPSNCRFDLAWKLWLPKDFKFWGTF